MDVEEQAEQELNVDPLSEVLQGQALRQEQELVALQTRRQGTIESRTRVPRAFGGQMADVVLFGTFTQLASYGDGATSEVRGSAVIEHSQVVYRLVRDGSAWHVSDEHVLERQRRVIAPNVLRSLGLEYWRLLNDVEGAFFTGDFGNLDLILDGEALTQYRERVKAAAAANTLQRITLDGRVNVIDIEPDNAVLAFSGTRTAASIDPSTGLERPATQEPYAFVHRLERRGNDWKIVYELAATSLDGAAARSDCTRDGDS